MNAQTLTPLQKQQIQLSWVAQATHFFITGLHGFTDADLKAGVTTAVRAFFSGQSGASSIYTGTRHARVLIKNRLTEHGHVTCTTSMRPIDDKKTNVT